MKLNVLLILVMSVLVSSLDAQPLNWRESILPDMTPSSYSCEFDEVTEGSRAVKIRFTDTGTPYFVSDTFNVTANSAFSYSIDVLDNDPGMDVNQRVRFIDADGNGTNFTSGDYSADNADYQTYTYTGTTPADAVKAYVIIRMYDGGGWTGSGTFWLDNAVYTEDGGANILVNGEFENWPVPSFDEGSTVVDWYESSLEGMIPIEIEPEITDVSHGDVAVKISFTETGTPYFVCDTFDVTANSAFSFSIDVLDNDAGMDVNQRVMFIDADGNGTNSTSGEYSADNAAYQTYTYTGTTPADAVKAYVIIRMYDGGGWTGSGTFWLDNAMYTEDGGKNLLPNRSFEEWLPPSNLPEFLSFSFEGLDPAVTGLINSMDKSVNATVPFGTDVTALVATFEVTEGATVKVGDTDQVSGTTANDFTSAVTYTLTSDDGTLTDDWVVTVTAEAPTTGNDIVSFRFEDLSPAVNGIVNAVDHTVTAEVPNGTDLTTLVPTIVLSENATSSPESGLATDFTDAVTYTVTAQDGGTQDWVVTVTEGAAGKTVLFSEDFETIGLIPSDWVLINADGYTQASGEERWQDSAWVITTSSRPELAGTKVAMASSYCSDMPLDGAAYDWMILPSIEIGNNTTLSWQAMSTTSSGNYPDDYIVIIAPAVSGGTPNVDYMEAEGRIVVQVAPESWSAGVGNPGEGLSSYSVNLKELTSEGYEDGWSDRDVWIAWVCNTDRYTNPDTGVPNSTAGGSNIAVDNILVVNDAGTGIETRSLSTEALSVYPNPSEGFVKLKLELSRNTTAQIEVVDIVGKTVFSSQHAAIAGSNVIDLDLTSLHEGIYFVKTSANGTSGTAKLILK